MVTCPLLVSVVGMDGLPVYYGEKHCNTEAG
jgi:hypothetical protein